jgi:RNA polymerase sigma factor (sigma-70 family)
VSGDRAATPDAIAATFREEAGRICSALVRQLGDFDLAEDLVQEAVVAALEHWPADGIPDNPAAWLMRTARNRGIDRLRRDARFREKLALLRMEPPQTEATTDDRLRLIFTCCHPALRREAQIALTLRAVLGMSTAQIARAFIVPEATIAQRIVRAKRKIVEARIPYRVPSGPDLEGRLSQVLDLLYLLFNEGFLSSGPRDSTNRDLAADAIWLCRTVTLLLPRQADALSLLALMQLHEARRAARFSQTGAIVLLQDQDRSRWDRTAIRQAGELLERARRLGIPGRYWLEAAIAACHAEAPSFAATDWEQVLALYGALIRIVPTPVVRLNRAIALWHVAGPAAALDEIESLAPDLDRYHLYHATRAQLLREFGRSDEAAAADRRALELTQNPAEQALLERRIATP